MNLYIELCANYKNVLNTIDRSRALNELLKLDVFNFNNSKLITIQIDFSSNISLTTINDLLIKIISYICKDICVKNEVKINNNLQENELIIYIKYKLFI